MIFDLQRKTAAIVGALVLVLIVASASLLAMAMVRAPARDTESQVAPQLEEIRTTRAAQAEAALKLQGGSRILLRLDTDALREAIAIGLRDDVRRMLREARIPFSGAAARDAHVEMRVRESKDRERALGKLELLLAASPSGGRNADVADSGDGVFRLTPTEREFSDRLQ